MNLRNLLSKPLSFLPASLLVLGLALQSQVAYAQYVEDSGMFKWTYVLDLGGTMSPPSSLVLRWTPGNAEGIHGTTTSSVSTSSDGPWSVLGSVNHTTYRSPPTGTYWITYVTMYAIHEDFRYVKIQGTVPIDYCSAEVGFVTTSAESSGVGEFTRVVDLGTVVWRSPHKTLVIWWKPGFSSGSSGEVSFSVSHDNVHWTEIGREDFVTHDSPPGSGNWITYGSLYVPGYNPDVPTHRYVKVHGDYPIDYVKVARLWTSEGHPYGPRPPTPGAVVNEASAAHIDLISPSPAEEGTTVQFSGHGTDPDGHVEAYSWRSSIDGQLSTSASFSKSDFSGGIHTIYFKVRDNLGAWSEEEVFENLTIPVKPTITLSVPSSLAMPAEYNLTIYFHNPSQNPVHLTGFQFDLYENDSFLGDIDSSLYVLPDSSDSWSKHFEKKWDWCTATSMNTSPRTHTYDISGWVKDYNEIYYDYEKVDPPSPVSIEVYIPQRKINLWYEYVALAVEATVMSVAGTFGGPIGWVVGGISEATCWAFASSALDDAEDPPEVDPEYKSVVKPTYVEIKFPKPETRAEEICINKSKVAIKLIGDLKALRVSRNRLFAATKARDQNAVASQQEAVKMYTQSVIEGHLRYRSLVELLIKEIQRIRFKITPAQIREFQTRIVLEGLPQLEVEILKKFDLTDQEIELIKDNTVRLAPRAIEFIFVLEETKEAIEKVAIDLGEEIPL